MANTSRHHYLRSALTGFTSGFAFGCGVIIACVCLGEGIVLVLQAWHL